MQIVFDTLPIIIFFIIYKLHGIYAATVAAILVSLLQLVGYRIIKGKFEPTQLLMLIMIVLLGSATLLLHNPIFIKWKPTVVSWCFAVGFIASHFIGQKLLIQRMLGDKFTLATTVWRRLNISWALFFSAMGSANLLFAYYTSTEVWVNFKLFGILGLTLLFAMSQSLYLARHLS